MSPSRQPRRVPRHRLVAAEIRGWRAKLQMSQVEMSDLLGVTQQSVSRKLAGWTPFTIDELDILADAFGIDLAELFPIAGATGGAERRAGSRCSSRSDRRHLRLVASAG